MLNDYIELGHRVELKTVSRVKMNGEEPVEKIYSSKIYDIISEERIEVLMPYEQSKLVLLPVDSEYEVYVYTGMGLFACKARIVDRYKSNNVYILVLELKTNLRKFQRRQYYRLSCALELGTRELIPEEMKELESGKRYLVKGIPLQRGMAVDISGGGIRFVSETKYEKGTILYCNFTLRQKEGQKEYEVAANVLESKKLENRPGFYEYRLQYVNIGKTIREEIIRYIFEEERKKVKKEKGFDL